MLNVTSSLLKPEIRVRFPVFALSKCLSAIFSTWTAPAPVEYFDIQCHPPATSQLTTSQYRPTIITNTNSQSSQCAHSVTDNTQAHYFSSRSRIDSLCSHMARMSFFAVSVAVTYNKYHPSMYYPLHIPTTIILTNPNSLQCSAYSVMDNTRAHYWEEWRGFSPRSAFNPLCSHGCCPFVFLTCWSQSHFQCHPRMYYRLHLSTHIFVIQARHDNE
jgi:hypothetical protein